MAVYQANLSARDYYRTRLGADAIDLGEAKIVESAKLESPETAANRERVTRNLQGRAK